MIKALQVQTNDLIFSPEMFSMAEVTVHVTFNLPMISPTASNASVDLSMAVSTFKGVGDVDVIPMTFSALIGGVEMSVNRREGVTGPGVHAP